MSTQAQYGQAVMTRRADITEQAVVDTGVPSAGDGEVVLRIDRFAITANNVTYAATGDIIGYWRFFPSGDEARGLVPAWGFATVVDSACDGIAEGERVYGFFPMASHVRLLPGRIKAHQFVDTASHRATLPALYNAYQRVDAWPAALDAEQEARYMLLFPLTATAFLLHDFLDTTDYLGATQLIVGSASGKTAVSLIQRVAESAADVRVVGLTSARNRAFVESLGWCDAVHDYDAVDAIPVQPSIYVDMAGNADVKARLHHHLGDAMVHSCAVGTSHWDRFAPPADDLPGAKPTFFFAPAHAEKRAGNLGSEELQRRIVAAWQHAAAGSAAWLTVRADTGPEAVQSIYARAAGGEMPPSEGWVTSLNPPS